MTDALVQLAARQWGVISTWQLRGLGLGRRAVERLVSAGTLIVVRWGVYRVAGAPVSWEQAVLASVLSSGGDAVASHTTAGALWALKHCDRYVGGLHLTAERRVRVNGAVGHQVRLSEAKRTVHRFIPVTSPERTLIDLASALSPRQLGECLDDALRRRLMRLDRLERLVAAGRGPGRRLLAPVHRILADRHPGYRPGDSDWEREMDRLWDRLHLPAAVRQYRVTAAGHHYRIDRAIPGLKIGVEWDGFAVHGTRSGFDHGSDRRADLTAEGWHMIDFTSNSTPDRIVRAVQRAAQERSSRLSASA